MGMFDSVNVKCPKCGEVVEFQSKAGNCYLDNYFINKVPISIAIALHGSKETCICDYVVTLVTYAFDPRVRMCIDEVKDD